MAKFSGAIGFVRENKQVRPGIYTDEVIEKNYRGNVLESPSSARWSEDSTTTNDKFILTNRISIVANPYAFKNYPWAKYVRWNGVNWKIRTIELVGRRIIFTLGEVWNGPVAETT